MIIFGHHASAFDSKFLLQILAHPSSKRLINRVQAFSKESEVVLKIAIEFSCLICCPEDLPKRPFEFATLSTSKERMTQEYEREFFEMLDVVKTEICHHERLLANRDSSRSQPPPEATQRESHPRLVDSDASLIKSSDESEWARVSEVTSSDCLSDEEIEGLSTEQLLRRIHAFNESRKEKRINNSSIGAKRRQRKCRHKSALPLRKVEFRDSNLLLRSSLKRASDAMASSSLQLTKCAANPDVDPNESVICLSPTAKSCSCCKSREHIPTDHPELLKFADICFGDSSKLKFLTQKWSEFPFSLLNDMPQLERMPGFPSRDYFVNNHVSPPQQMTEREYLDVKILCQSYGVITARDLLVFYSLSDSIILSLVVTCAYKLLFREFNLNVLRFNTVSRLVG